MHNDTVTTHLNSAKALYRERMGLLQSNRIDMNKMIDLEYRLRIHIHVLARRIDNHEKQPEQAADVFIYLAVRFSSMDKAYRRAAANLACVWLLKENSIAYGARDALMLYPLPEVYRVIQKTYGAVESLRSVLIYILTQQGDHLPESLMRMAGQKSHDSLLQAQTIYYAANDRNTDTEMFKQFYDPILSKRQLENIGHSTFVAAIWGGLVRGDVDARVVLQRSIENEKDETKRLDFIRFAALSGQEKYFPAIKNIAELAPEVGYHFLALHGQTQSIEFILDGLTHPRTSNYAAQAWWWISGQALPRVSRLSLVGQINSAAVLEEEVGTIPNAEVAHRWWKKNNNGFSIRWLQGQPFNKISIHSMLKKYSGLIGSELVDLYALSTQTPLRIGHYTWHYDRLRKINNLTRDKDTQKSKTSELENKNIG